MPRIHTRVKRMLGLTSSKKHRFRNATKAKGAKTFPSEDKATAYATDVLKLKEYKIAPAKRNKRFKIV